jgi:hypothetical protein
MLTVTAACVSQIMSAGLSPSIDVGLTICSSLSDSFVVVNDNTRLLPAQSLFLDYDEADTPNISMIASSSDVRELVKLMQLAFGASIKSEKNRGVGEACVSELSHFVHIQARRQYFTSAICRWKHSCPQDSNWGVS